MHRAVQVEVVKLEEDILAVDLHTAEVMFSVGIVVGRKGVECLHCRDNAGLSFGTKGDNACRQQQGAAGQRAPKLVVEVADGFGLVFVAHHSALTSRRCASVSPSI